MKRYATVNSNLVENIIKVDDSEPLNGRIDVTSIPCAIGWPIVAGVPEGRPSKYHTLISGNLGWELTTSNEALMLADAKQICIDYANRTFESDLKQPINDGTDDIICTGIGRNKMLGAKNSGKPSLIVQMTNGRSKTLTVPQVNTLISDLDDRDDSLLSDLETDLDAIDAATTLSELDPYMP